MGYINGARVALSHFKKRNKGILINVSSIVGTIGQPYTSPYVVSKFAIRGFSEALRWELEEAGIQVCAVLPGSIDTPLFQQGANYLGKAPQPMKPIYAAQEVAEKIVTKYPLPNPLTIEQLNHFINENPVYNQIQWIDS